MSWSWLGSDDADENDEGNADQNEMVTSLVMLCYIQLASMISIPLI